MASVVKDAASGNAHLPLILTAKYFNITKAESYEK